MEGRRLRSLILICILSLFPKTLAQSLTATDTSPQSIRRYQNIIKKNRQLVSLIEYTFTKRGVPKHMRNLAIIESGLNHDIVSDAGAKGVWQFMTGHASQYGLSEKDRSDMFRSTKTVVNSLINLYNKFGNWITVVAAYNCGEGNIRKAMAAAGSKKYTDFGPFLPEETQNHVRKFLNACYATGELNQVLADYYKVPPRPARIENIKPERKPAAFGRMKNGGQMRETMLNGAYDLDIVADVLNISKSQLLIWNPGIEERLKLQGESVLYLPREQLMDFEINKNKILDASLKK